MSPEAWQNPEARALAVQRASMDHDGRLDIVLMLVNGAHDPIAFHVPGPPRTWHLLVNSTDGEADIREFAGPTVDVPGHGVLVFANRVPRALRVAWVL